MFDHTYILYMYIYICIYIYILKIDIEPSEYDFVVKLFMQDWLPFKQLLIEYHDRCLIENIEWKHKLVIKMLEKYGFKQYHPRNSQEYSHIKEIDILKEC